MTLILQKVPSFSNHDSNPNSFVIDENHEFEDYHSGFDNTYINEDLQDIFKPEAIINDKVGYVLSQTYSCNGGDELSSNTIYRRFFYDEDNLDKDGVPIQFYQIKKKS